MIIAAYVEFYFFTELNLNDKIKYIKQLSSVEIKIVVSLKRR